MRNQSTKKVLSIFTLIFLLMATFSLTVVAIEDSTIDDEHIHDDSCYHEYTQQDETTAEVQSEDYDVVLCAIFGHSMYKVSEYTINGGGSGYDYCKSLIVIETWNCLSCNMNPESRTGEITTIPHDWSVGWCGQTCNECGIVEMFHEEGGCWYCS